VPTYSIPAGRANRPRPHLFRDRHRLPADEVEGGDIVNLGVSDTLPLVFSSFKNSSSAIFDINLTEVARMVPECQIAVGIDNDQSPTVEETRLGGWSSEIVPQIVP
jgi:hypothetical protein